MKKTRNIIFTIFSFVLLLTMALGFVGCNDNNSGTPSGGEEQQVVVISLNKTTLELDERSEDQQLTARVTVDGKIITDPQLVWESLDTNVVTVTQSGLVSVVGKGETAVTCTYEGKTSSCSIKVNKYYAPAFDLTVNYTTVNITKFEYGYTFDIEVSATYSESGEVANPEYTFVSSNSAVATVDAQGKVTIVGGGDCVITVTGSLDGGSANAKVTISVALGGSEGTIVPDQPWDI